jgi:U3 small nucleolar RNA-associated protein 14
LYRPIMPGRQSHGGPPSRQPKSRVNNKKRSINAFAIAAQQNPENIKIRQHRLGDIEGNSRPTKRARTEENTDDKEDASSAKAWRKNAVKGRFDELDIDAGSDSEGNEWRMGHVDSDDDSDLDSDEAFGDSDEERFEGFAFSGSSTRSKAKKNTKGARSRDITLSELDNTSKMESGSEGDSLGDEAIDLAAMLDATEEDEDDDDKVSTEKDSKEDEESDEEGSDVGTTDSDNSSFISSMEQDDEDDPDKIAALQNLVASLPQAEASEATLRQRSDGASEYNTPSDFGITSKAKLTLEDLGLPSIRDPFLKKSLKLLASESKSDPKRTGISGKLEVPLAKRQQDRLDRSAAYEKSKETLDRWTDTVKHNRRAEHLIFPLPDADAASANANVRLQPTTNSRPFNELEATIQTILEESGLAATNGKDDEDKMMEFEELETNKMSIEEVKARRAQLRMARDLLFREEARAKRIKKIKSKSYRKVHRKQREKASQTNRQALIEAGVEPSEDEQELQDRRRAEERMGAKHRDSKWAKATKQTGRAAWDEDARAGITEMARRDEELRKRVEGRASRKDGAEESESSISDSEDESIGDKVAEQARLLRKLKGAGKSDGFADSGPGSKLSNMKFMLKAEASRKKENDATVEQMKKELAGESSSEDAGNNFAEVGRRTFGPGSTQIKVKDTSQAQKANDFEEPEDSGDEDAFEIRTTSQAQEATSRAAPEKDHQRSISRQKPARSATSDPPATETGGGAWSRTASQKDKSESRRRKQKLNSATDVEELDISNATVIAKQIQPKRLNAKQSTLQVDNSDDEDLDGNGDGTLRLPYAIRDQELIKRAFAGADVVGEFEAEKRQTIVDEGEKTIDNTLPGWGSWVGDGVSKKDKRQNKGRFLTKSEGIKEQDRKDAKLDRVIINEKRVKKVSLTYTPLFRTSSDLCRMANILHQIFHTPSKLGSSTKDLCDCLWGLSGLRRRHSRMPQNRGF